MNEESKFLHGYGVYQSVAGTHKHYRTQSTDSFIPAAAFTLSRGTPDLAVRGSTTEGQDKVPAWAMDSATFESVTGVYEIPADWVSGTSISFTIYWAPATNATGNVLWQLTVSPIEAGDQIDESTAASPQQIGAAPAVADQLVKTTVSTAITPTGRFIRIGILRRGDDGSDTFNAVDAWFIGLKLTYTGVLTT